ncbi:putative membrane protein [Waddlia chondrophila 2032/99]|uniref:Putative membrane protein n=2 Tax=Waddlia chondrophila TaxID=71667 RepID=D6YWS8_WADCW|nr:hypothetical protein [Waddlia chondrophila]ADI38589.1 putative membrane protein [Waddlia chondrophila WSU 86-1044]CCB91708.1 putative membrane protein [Waddlia chondrophila 2032/99]
MSDYIGYEVAANVLEAGFAASSGALAVLALGSCVDPAVGAFGAVVGWLAGKPVQYLTTKIFNTDNPAATMISRIAQFACSFFANAAIFMWSVGRLGVSLSFAASCGLAGTAIGIQMAFILAVSTFATLWLKGSQV